MLASPKNWVTVFAAEVPYRMRHPVCVTNVRHKCATHAKPHLFIMNDYSFKFRTMLASPKNCVTVFAAEAPYRMRHPVCVTNVRHKCATHAKPQLYELVYYEYSFKFLKMLAIPKICVTFFAAEVPYRMRHLVYVPCNSTVEILANIALQRMSNGNAFVHGFNSAGKKKIKNFYL